MLSCSSKDQKGLIHEKKIAQKVVFSAFEKGFLGRFSHDNGFVKT